MSATFTEDDIDKRVQNANGEVIGTVTEVESEIVRVEPRSGVVDSIRSALGWGRSSEETVSIHAESVEEITVDTIHLETDSTVELDEEPTSASTDATAAETSSTELEADSLDESTTAASSASDEGGSDAAIDDTDRGIATDESDRGITTDDPDRGIGTEEPPHDAADEAREPGTPERRPESDDTTTQDPGDRQEAFEEGGRERGAPDTEAMGRTTADPDAETEIETADDAGTIEATDRIDRAADEVEADEFGGTADEMEAEAESEPDAGTDADITTAASDETDTMESMNAAKGPGAMGNSEVGDSEIDDAGETMDADESETTNAEHGDAADDEHGDGPSHSKDVEHLEGDPPIEPDPRTVANDVSEPTDLDADETIGHADETDIADEFSTGVDRDSLEDVGGTDDTKSDTTGTETETEDRALTDAVDQGVDIESAAETGSEPEASSSVEETDTEAMDLTDEVDTGIDAASAVESEREAGTSADADTATSTDADAESGAGVDIETLPGQQVDAEIGPEAGARRAMTEASVSSDDIDRREADVDRTRAQDRADAQTAESSPIAALFATQRAAMKGGQEAIELGLATQQNAARAALEGTHLVQRGSLEIAEMATRQYVNAFGAMLGTGTGSRTETETGPTRSRDARRTGTDTLSQTGALTLPDIEELQSQVDDDHLAQELETHREHIRELRSAVEDAVERGHDQPTDQLVDLLERQAELLEQCQQHLEGD